jgi:YidC/Oxa1 family membrane protein insertase
MNNNKNILLAMALCAATFFLWQYFIANPAMKAEQARQAHLTHQEKTKPGTAPVLPGVAAGDAHMTREAALKAGGKRVVIDTPMVDGSILLKGARIDDLRLKTYRETVDPKSPEIVLLAPRSTDYPYYADFGWVAQNNQSGMPDANSQWTQTSGGTLSPGHPVTLSFDNGHGLVFTRIIAIDDKFMFSVSDSVANHGGGAVTLYPYGSVTRQNLPKSNATWSLHEGFVGWLDGGERDSKYSDFKDAGTPPKTWTSTGGWLGITDKYWMAAVVPPQGESIAAEYAGAKTPAGADAFQADYRLGARTLKPGATVTVNHRLFAGAKVVDILRNYQDNQNVPRFDQAVDWGWFFFLTRPFFWLLDHLYKILGNFGLAILGLTVIVKIVMFPLANAGFRSMSKMKKLQPQMEALKTAHKDDPQSLQVAMMELYKREKANPVSGCVPILLTIPVFFSLYKVLYVTIEMRHAPFYGWIHDLSDRDPTSWINLFGVLPFDPNHYLAYLPSFAGVLSIGVWPILYGLTQWMQTKLNPPPPDPVQAKMFAFMPLIFTFMFGTFPAGLVIYYAWNNLLGVLQQAYIMKREGVEISFFDNVRGRKKTDIKAANDR